ncbi:hypothetical protein LRY65_04375 [Candidatus Woesebacteria bacterium]|nr:hypothetical protein [Candidatus Woesebacteria bacterium]
MIAPWRKIDEFLNEYTMYRVVLYALVVLAGIAFFFSAVGILDYSFVSLLSSIVLLGVSCVSVNRVAAWALSVPTNVESAAITSLILFFVVTPPQNFSEGMVLVGVGAISMLSKYLLAWQKKHVFNPVAIALVIAGILGLPIASWWVATPVLAPFTLILGILVVRKIRRFGMVGAFILAASMGILGLGLWRGANLTDLVYELYASWPIAFFATFMLTEPLTTPPTWQYRVPTAFWWARFLVPNWAGGGCMPRLSWP